MDCKPWSKISWRPVTNQAHCTWNQRKHITTFECFVWLDQNLLHLNSRSPFWLHWHVHHCLRSWCRASDFCVGWRSAPEQSAAEVTHFVLVVAIWTQWSHLAVCPLLIWQSIYCQTPITKAPCHQTAINAWPAEHLRFTPGEHPKVGFHCYNQGTINGRALCCRQCLLVWNRWLQTYKIPVPDQCYFAVFFKKSNMA